MNKGSGTLTLTCTLYIIRGIRGVEEKLTVIEVKCNMDVSL